MLQDIENGKEGTRKGKAAVKGFLHGIDPAQNQGSIATSAPNADLFPETTVMFADMSK